MPVGKVCAKTGLRPSVASAPAQRAVFGERVGETVRQRDCLAVAVEHHQHGHIGSRTAEAELHAVDEAVKRMSRIEIAGQQLVAHGGPRRLTAQLERQAMRVAEFEQLRGDERRGVGQRDETEPQMGFLERPR